MYFNRKLSQRSKPSENLKNTLDEKNLSMDANALQQCKRMLNCFVLLERINLLDFSSYKMTDNDKTQLLTSIDAFYLSEINRKPIFQCEICNANFKTKVLKRRHKAFNCLVKPTIKVDEKLDMQSINKKYIQFTEVKENINCEQIELFPFINSNINNESKDLSATEKFKTATEEYKKLSKQDTLNENKFSKDLNALKQFYKIMNCFILLEKIDLLDLAKNRNDYFAVDNPCTLAKDITVENSNCYELQVKPSKLENSIKRNTSKSKCKSCNIQHTDETEFSKHILSHKRDNGYVCIFCTKHFSEKSQLKEHMFVHKEGNSFNCAICYKSLYTKTDILNEKCIYKKSLVTSTKCSKVLNSKETLKRYLDLH